MKPGGLDIPARQPKVVRAWVLACMVATAAFTQPPVPAWVKKAPRSEDQYVGIGRADKRAHPENYRELAHTSALAHISREISAQVKSEATAIQTEDDRGVRESYVQKIRVASANELAGYQSVEDYETGEEYWVLVVLEKSAHEKFLNGKADELIARLKRGIPDLRADLRNRRFQDAMDRVAEMRREHSTFIATHPIPDERRASLDFLCDSARAMLREAARHPLEISLDIQTEGSEIPEETIRRLRGALSHLHSPFYRVTQKFQDGATLKIRILGVDRDTLEGITFTALRGEMCWPGDPIPRPVQGKSGHPDRDRSLSLAIRDFVKTAGGLPP